MTISIIAAHDWERGIGKDNSLMWKISADMQYFRLKTIGNIIVMGSNTYKSIGKPLPHRKNVVLSKKPAWEFPAEVSVANSINTILRMAKSLPDEEIFIIGGADIYRQFLPYADTLYLTEVGGAFYADTFFPEILLSEWSVTIEQRVPAKGENKYELAFKTYRRVKGQA